jgi:hypothetical protein
MCHDSIHRLVNGSLGDEAIGDAAARGPTVTMSDRLFGCGMTLQ